MKIKLLQEEHLKEAAKLCRRSMQRDSLPDFLFKEKVFDEPDYRKDLNLIACNDSDKIVGLISAVIKERRKGKIGYLKLMCVDENYRRGGIANKLYYEIEKKFIQEQVELIRLFESFPNYIMPGIDPFYTEAVCFFERAGFKKFNDTANLTVDLLAEDYDVEDSLQKLQEDGIEIRRATDEDRIEIINWLNSNFPDWIPEVSIAFDNNPISLFIAIHENQIKGFSAYEVNNRGTGWFGPMGTDRQLQGKGTGGVLLRVCMNELKKEGFAKAIIPWVGPIPFYTHYTNAKVSRVFWRYEKFLR